MLLLQRARRVVGLALSFVAALQTACDQCRCRDKLFNDLFLSLRSKPLGWLLRGYALEMLLLQRAQRALGFALNAVSSPELAQHLPQFFAPVWWAECQVDQPAE